MLFLQEFERENHVFSFARALSTLIYATIHRSQRVCPLSITAMVIYGSVLRHLTEENWKNTTVWNGEPTLGKV